ncbi:hypothetical protein B0T26DRAFT_673270 [Lasiosphaeria miniovina]|uniref:Uncharacterized protein n=1 Tax=Lasiosphaeria miniovina TaxID=1954250 RepID=A0AA40E8B6_9PEZI|nr:uncharacterized protein B0T26DRAFT_673270 [Lasiosphaeria miniovina]KAK0728797.1 hypothetical protein B0T26DRAFT_673270 [Lasiosphaeria miniovina]
MFGELVPEHRPWPKRAADVPYASRLNYFSLNRQSCPYPEVALFRLPSFCALLSRRLEAGYHPAIFHRHSRSPTLANSPSSTKYTQQYLNEILRSYIILFGPDKRSRDLFRSQELAKAQVGGQADPLLTHLSPKKVRRLGSAGVPWTMPTRGFYGPDDFPLLGEKLLRLQDFNMQKDSSTLREFWADQRNPFNFYTSWAVLVFGLMSILLSLVHCALSMAQLVVSLRQLQSTSDN